MDTILNVAEGWLTLGNAVEAWEELASLAPADRASANAVELRARILCALAGDLETIAGEPALGHREPQRSAG